MGKGVGTMILGTAAVHSLVSQFLIGNELPPGGSRSTRTSFTLLLNHPVPALQQTFKNP